MAPGAEGGVAADDSAFSDGDFSEGEFGLPGFVESNGVRREFCAPSKDGELFDFEKVAVGDPDAGRPEDEGADLRTPEAEPERIE